jgi:hypothetical protein
MHPDLWDYYQPWQHDARLVVHKLCNILTTQEAAADHHEWCGATDTMRKEYLRTTIKDGEAHVG